MSHLSHSNEPKSNKNKFQLKKIKNIAKSFNNIKLSMSNTNGIFLNKNLFLIKLDQALEFMVLMQMEEN